MAVRLETSIKRWRGLSTDEKPGRFAPAGQKLQIPPTGSTFTEEDTGRRYVWDGSWPWVRQEQTIETLFEDLTALTRRVLAVLEATHHGNEEHVWETEVEIETGELDDN